MTGGSQAARQPHLEHHGRNQSLLLLEPILVGRPVACAPHVRGRVVLQHLRHDKAVQERLGGRPQRDGSRHAAHPYQRNRCPPGPCPWKTCHPFECGMREWKAAAGTSCCSYPPPPRPVPPRLGCRPPFSSALCLPEPQPLSSAARRKTCPRRHLRGGSGQAEQHNGGSVRGCASGRKHAGACVCGAAASAGCARCAPPAPPASSAAASRARRGRRGGGGPGERTPQAQHRRWDVQPAGRKPGAARSTHWWQQTGCCSDTSWKRRASCPQPAGPAARAADQGVADAERGCARRQAAHLPATGCLLAGLTSMICWNLVRPSFAAAQAQAHIQRRIEGSRGRRRRAR